MHTWVRAVLSEVDPLGMELEMVVGFHIGAGT